MSNNFKVLKYWYDSLLLGKRASASLEDSYYDIETEVLARGALSISAFNQYLKKNTRNKKNITSDFHEVLICPVVFSGSRNSLIAPLWIPAIIDSEGVIRPAKNHMPWIPRKYLEPIQAQGKRSFVLGEASDSEEFFKKYKHTKVKNWDESWSLAKAYFKYVTGESFGSIQIKSFSKKAGAALILDESIRGAHVHIEKLYRQLLKEKLPLGLLSKITETKKTKTKVYSRSRHQAKKTSMRHVGQFEDTFSLSHSQRIALHRVLEMQDNSLVCVSGPPGTGKTTLIQSVAASLWVESAYRGDERPPVIAACGETNQSVTNIIRSFSSSSNAENISSLSGRWLPHLKGYGSYCCSKMKEKTHLEFHIELTTGEGFSCGLESEKYLNSALRFYLEKSKKHFSKDLSLKKTKKLLQAALVDEVRQLKKEVSGLSSGGLFSRIKEASGRGDYKSFRSLIAKLAVHDTSKRFRAFQLATHYWEACWLDEMIKVLSQRFVDGDDAYRFRNHPDDWSLRAMLTPVFVSTFSMAPRFFYPSYESAKKTGAGRSGDIKKPPIDLLIVDEAAKSSPETAAPTFALAAKALVVGDRNQLEPVWNITRINDSILLKKHKLKSSVKKGMLSSSGDLMALASEACTGVEQDPKGSTVGVFLSEHRRCVPEIVSFCNEIAYLGRLEPLRKELPERVLPAMGFSHVEGKGAKTGASRLNKEEAKSIEQWLENNEIKIKEFYETGSLDEVVAVITPFFAQARLLEKLLLPKYPNMTIGTVGALQGAESKIVIFSSVYDKSFKPQYFFDKSINHLNVAVSRAKDSFLVFGDMRIFKKNSQSPSGVLARSLFKRKEQDIREST